MTGELRAIVTSDPLSERPRELLMRALVAGGRHAEALATYHEPVISCPTSSAWTRRRPWNSSTWQSCGMTLLPWPWSRTVS